MSGTPEQRLLARFMSTLSEDYWCAGWMTGCEYALWADLTGAEVRGNKGWSISQTDKEELQVLQKLTGGWVYWPEELEQRIFLPTQEWLDHLASVRPTVGLDHHQKDPEHY